MIEGCQAGFGSKRIMWMERLFSKEKAMRDRKRYRIFADTDLIGPYPSRNLGCGSILYRQGRIKRAFIPYRSNGLVAMVKQMRLYAMAYRAKEQQ